MSSNGEDTEPSSPRPGSSSDCECKVCFATPARTHFGATTCRPCAAFFRRAVVLKKQYKCGLNGDCPITKTVRVICPFCRYKKCLKVGMKIENIRFNFDKTGPKRRSPSCPLQTKKKSILDEMTLGYKKFIEETQNLYYALNPESLFDKTLEFRPGTLNDCLQFERAQFVYVLKMLNEHFQPFSDFSDEEKRQIFEIFQYPFGHLNRLYLNSLYFRADDSKLLLNLGIYAQADCFTHFYSNDRHPHASAQILKPFQIKVVKIAKKFKNIRIDAVETAALAGIILWRDLAYYLDCSDYDHLVDQINHELYEYCKRKDGNREVGTRFGLVLSVLRGIEDMMTMNKENIVVLLLTGDHLHRPFADITALGTR